MTCVELSEFLENHPQNQNLSLAITILVIGYSFIIFVSEFKFMWYIFRADSVRDGHTLEWSYAFLVKKIGKNPKNHIFYQYKDQNPHNTSDQLSEVTFKIMNIPVPAIPT